MLKELEKIVECVRFHFLLMHERPLVLMEISAVFSPHPQPRSAHVQRLAPTSTVRCMSVYVSLSTLFPTLSSPVRLDLVFSRSFLHFFSFIVLSGLVAEPVGLFLEASYVRTWR